MDITRRGGGIIAVSTDAWEDIFFRVDQLQMGMTFIADPKREVIDRYGLRDATLGHDVARPASFIIDAEGRVAWRHLPTDWRLRAAPDVYMNALESVRRGEVPP